MDFLLEQFEEAKEVYKDDPFMSPCCNSGWAKLDKYYGLTDRTPVYIAAIILCPQYKWAWIEANWDQRFHASCRQKVLEFWESDYMPTAMTIPVSSVESTEKSKNTFADWQKRKNAALPITIMDEYTKYCQLDPLIDEDINPRDWWREPAQRKAYPNLNIMTLDILSIPAMSAEPERLFSGAKTTITDRRNKLGIEFIQAIKSLKSWWHRKAGPKVINWADLEEELVVEASKLPV
jgi:hypothetical protein